MSYGSPVATVSVPFSRAIGIRLRRWASLSGRVPERPSAARGGPGGGCLGWGGRNHPAGMVGGKGRGGVGFDPNSWGGSRDGGFHHPRRRDRPRFVPPVD